MLATQKRKSNGWLKKEMVVMLRSDKSLDGKFPQLSELSKTFNVSVPTARNALKGLEKRGEVVVKHGSGIYISDKCERNILETTFFHAAPGKKTILVLDAMVAGDDVSGHTRNNFVLDEAIKGAEEACIKAQWGLKLVTYVIGDGDQAILRYINRIKNEVTLLVMTRHFIPMIKTVKEAGVPVILIGPIGHEAVDCIEVCRDWFEVGRLAGQHLAELGHEEVLYVGNSPAVNKASNLKYLGFRSAYENACSNFKIYEVFIPESMKADEMKKSCCLAAQKAFEMKGSVSAMYISSDVIASIAVPYLLQHEVQIPRDVSLVTSDNSHYGKLFTPIWTSVDPNLRGAAKVAAEIQISWANGLPMGISSFYVSPKLVLGGSTVPRTKAAGKLL